MVESMPCWRRAMDTPEKLGTHQKALVDQSECQRCSARSRKLERGRKWRGGFCVGGASGTVAKTISAYDKEVSDDLYGAGTRYVSKPRLQAMLDNEWAQLLVQLQATRGATTKFFSFVDTISARNFSGTNDCHGWVGLRFLQQPGGLHERRDSARESARFQQCAAAGSGGNSGSELTLCCATRLDEPERISCERG